MGEESKYPRPVCPVCHGHSKSRSRSKNDSTCCCAEGMADQLEKFEGYFAFVFEEHHGGITYVLGTIKEVKQDGQILHMEDFNKIISFNGNTFVFSFEDIYISICEITEFIPLYKVTPATIAQINVIKEQVLQRTNATRII